MSDIPQGPLARLEQEQLTQSLDHELAVAQFTAQCMRLIDGAEPEQVSSTALYTQWYRTPQGLLEVGVNVDVDELYKDDVDNLGVDLFNPQFSLLSQYARIYPQGQQYPDVLEVDSDGDGFNETEEYVDAVNLMASLDKSDNIPLAEDLPQRDAARAESRLVHESAMEDQTQNELHDGWAEGLDEETKEQVTTLRSLVFTVLNDVDSDGDGAQTIQALFMGRTRLNTGEVITEDNANLERDDDKTLSSIKVRQKLPDNRDFAMYGSACGARCVIEVLATDPDVAEGEDPDQFIEKVKVLDIQHDGYPILWQKTNVKKVVHDDDLGIARIEEIPSAKKRDLMLEALSDDSAAAGIASNKLRFGDPEDGHESRATLGDIIEAQEAVKRVI